MKLLFLCMVLFHSLFSFTYTLEPKKISQSIYCFFGAPEVMDKDNNGNMVNSCFVDLGTSYLVIDTGPSYKYARDAHKAMKEIKDQKVSHVVNTHPHDDHWLGNGYFKEQGATIIGPKIFANTPKSEEIRMKKHISSEAFEGTTEVFPTEFVDGEQTLTLGGVKIYAKAYAKKAHSQSDLILFIPSMDVVFAGDLVFNQRILSLRDGDINNWLKAIEEIEGKGSRFIIGGHGTNTDKMAAKVTKEYLVDLKTYITDAIDEGVDIDQTVQNSHMPKYESLKLYELMHRANVESSYRTLEWGDE